MFALVVYLPEYDIFDGTTTTLVIFHESKFPVIGKIERYFDFYKPLGAV